MKRLICSDGIEYVSRDLEIPFMPFIGLTIWDKEDFEATIDSVSWEIGKEHVECWTEPSKYIDYALEDRLELYESMGWSRD